MGAGFSAAALAMVLASCSAEESAPKPQGERPALVAVATAEPAAGGDTVRATGTVRAKRETVLSFLTNGRIAAVLVEDGDRVAKGQLLARLDPIEVETNTAAARADAQRANADLKRVRELFEKGWAPRSRVDAAEAAASAANARLAQTGFVERYARIVAPTAGIVLRRHLEPGQTVQAGTPIVTLGEATGGYVLRAPLTDADLARVRIGQTATVTLQALGGAPLAARVVEIGGRGDERTGTFEVELALPARPDLRSGLIGDARIRANAGAGAGDGVVVPASAVWQARADQGFVYVVDARGRARSRLVGLGAVDDRQVVVTSGLTAGETVVIAGIDRLRDGGPVTTRRAG
ncbi:MAG: efflux RND transporter periplasmic adaptor subunit [Alphaproteobacteria bacterium]|nr:efflux RND transporter periplasmic adaptor subunit [Alphaproteobacteria bacterium]